MISKRTLKTIRRPMVHSVLLALAGALLTTSMGGCATYNAVDKRTDLADAQTKAGMQYAQSLKEKPVVSFSDIPFLMGESVPIAARDPAALAQTVQMATAQPLTLAQAAMFITQRTGVPVQVSGAISAQVHKAGLVSRSAQALPGLPGQAAFTLPALPNVNADRGQVVINYQGPLKGLLDLLAAQTHTYWSYENRAVRFFLTETRVFEINALPGKTNMSSMISNAGSGGAASSGGSGTSSGPASTETSSQRASITVDLDPYKAIESAIKTVLKQSGGDDAALSSVSVDPNSGQIIVTATPPELDAVAAYVKTINQQMEKNVLIDVRIYSVTTSDSADASLTLNATLSNITRNLGAVNLGGGSAATPSLSDNAISAGIVSGSFNANIMAQALASAGKVALVTSGTVIALNGQAAPLQVSTTNGYLAQTTTTNTANVGSSTSLTPGSVVSGFSGTFLPLVRGKNILLEYALNLSQNLGFLTASSNGSTIQVPNTALQTTSNRVSLRSGDTVVLTGFEQSGDQTTRNAGLTTLGKNASTSRTALVITMHVVNLGT